MMNRRDYLRHAAGVAAIAALPLSAGKRLNKADFDRSKEQLLTRLHNATYARAEVVPDTVVDQEVHTAVVTFELHPGTETTFGPINHGARPPSRAR